MIVCEHDKHEPNELKFTVILENLDENIDGYNEIEYYRNFIASKGYVSGEQALADIIDDAINP